MYCHCIVLINSFVGVHLKERIFHGIPSENLKIAALISKNISLHFQVSFWQYFSKKLIRTAYKLVETKEGNPNTHPQIHPKNICAKEDTQ